MLDEKTTPDDEQQKILKEILEKGYYENFKLEIKKISTMNIFKKRKENKHEFKTTFLEKLNLIFCPRNFCKKKGLKRYFDLLEIVNSKIENYLDYFNTIYLMEDVNIVKKIIFNDEQNSILEFIKKPILDLSIKQELDYLDEENITAKNKGKVQALSKQNINENLSQDINIFKSFNRILFKDLNKKPKISRSQNLTINYKLINLISSDVKLI